MGQQDLYDEGGQLRYVEASKEPQAPERRTAFTWRLTADQALALDAMMLHLKRELGRPKLDRAEMLTALVALAGDTPTVFAALTARMREKQVGGR